MECSASCISARGVKERQHGRLSDSCGVNEENEGGNLDEEDESNNMNSDEWIQVEQMSQKRKERGSDSEEIAGRDGRSNVKTMRKEDEYKVILLFETMGEMSNPMRLTKILRKTVGEIKSARYLTNNRVIVICMNKKQQDMLVKMKEFGGVGVKCHVPGEVTDIKGVITGVPMCLTDEILRNQLMSEKVIDVKRLTSNKNGKRELSTTVMITVSGKLLPENVKMGYVCYPVRPFIKPAMRCFNCQRLGHVADVCKGKKRCCKCGGEHGYGECGDLVKPKCCNCGGPHSAAYLGCIAQKQAVEANKYKAEHNVSYAQAVKKVQNEQGNRMNHGRSNAIETTDRGTDRCNPNVDASMLMISKVSFIAFIAEVINCTAQTNKRTEKLKIIISAAAHQLGINDVSVEKIQNLLGQSESNANSQETSDRQRVNK